MGGVIVVALEQNNYQSVEIWTVGENVSPLKAENEMKKILLLCFQKLHYLRDR